MEPDEGKTEPPEKVRGHLIGPISNDSVEGAREQLEGSYQFLIACVKESVNRLDDSARWGIGMKRLAVRFGADCKDRGIGKSEERLSELVNILATTERTIDALHWIEQEPTLRGLRVKECHPSTSGSKDGADIVLVDEERRERARFEVCDVVSSTSDGNGKEAKSLGVLLCLPRGREELAQGVRWFLVTSPEFAGLVQKREGRYHPEKAGVGTDTVILEVREEYARRVFDDDRSKSRIERIEALRASLPQGAFSAEEIDDFKRQGRP